VIQTDNNLILGFSATRIMRKKFVIEATQSVALCYRNKPEEYTPLSSLPLLSFRSSLHLLPELQQCLKKISFPTFQVSVNYQLWKTGMILPILQSGKS
jgi:hypothetical protein